MLYKKSILKLNANSHSSKDISNIQLAFDQMVKSMSVSHVILKPSIRAAFHVKLL